MSNGKLPIVSMEDEELFPKDSVLNVPQALPPFSFALFEQLYNITDENKTIWWSRLIISVRGYVANYFKNEEQKLFLNDDAFILLHKIFVEKTEPSSAIQFVEALYNLFCIPYLADGFIYKDQLRLSTNIQLNDEDVSIINVDDTRFRSGEIVFGKFNETNSAIASYQKDGYLVFMKILIILLNTFAFQLKEGKEKKKGIRFDIDNEWQPDDRVVLYQQFFTGNRTWLLYDFDRYIINFHRPNGVCVIFGRSYVEKKKRNNCHLCEACGMLEQQPFQFPIFRNIKFCTENCLSNLLEERNITL
uniref:Uncharacterized protein n=1 Tax=Rhabditophanes sp. KR3021 TaxID=114890 RepID=A0AC35UFY9_9BILA